jgi:hypothetical protein
MSAVGLTQEEIGIVVGVSDTTLRKHYAKELASAALKANAMVGQSLLHQAIGGPKQEWEKASTSAAIWWSKTRMGWKEPPQTLLHTGDESNPVAVKDVSAREQIASRIASISAVLRPSSDTGGTDGSAG